MTKIFDWNNILSHSEEFQTNPHFSFSYMENIFDKKFYEELFSTFPKLDDSWLRLEEPDKSTYRKFWFDAKSQEIDRLGNDPNFSNVFNTLHEYCHSNEFMENFSKFSGISNLKTKHFTFVNLKKGGFQYPHAHNASPSTLTMFFYFVKNWEEGDPGCTYFAKGENEDNDILVEPYNLDNAMTIFLDADNAWHGVRYIEKDIERQSICVIMERYNEEQKLWDAQIHSK